MTVWNVAVPVVADVEAATGAEAQERLHRALAAAGFYPVEVNHGYPMNLAPLEAEDGSEPDVLPTP